MRENNPKRISASGYRIGIVGGGQLAKMTAVAGLRLGCDVVVLERNNFSPAANLASHSLVGDWNSPEALIKLASQVDVVTLENEFVDADSLAKLEEAGYPLYPTSKTIALVQDKLIQKQTLSDAGIKMAAFSAVSTTDDIHKAADEFGWPLVLKARRNGYDGKGNATLNSASDIDAAWAKLDGDNRSLYVEAFCPFTKELAIMITRSHSGESVSYPLVESVQKDHICHIVRAPASETEKVIAEATELATKAVETIGGIGTIGVEMFLTENNEVLLNEMAPRVHNSGHYTIEACECSQFENHVRAVLGWPLGSTKMITPAAVMINLLGAKNGPGYPAGIEQALAVDGAFVHVYGKSMTTTGRKMGHLTALGASIENAENTASKAASLIQFGAAS